MPILDLLAVLQTIQALRTRFEVAEGNMRRARALVERCEIIGELLREIRRDVDPAVLEQSEAFSSALRRMSDAILGCNAFVAKYSMKGWQRRIAKFVNAKSIASEFDDLCRQLDQAQVTLHLSIGVRSLIKANDNNCNSEGTSREIYGQNEFENLDVMVEAFETNDADACGMLLLDSCENDSAETVVGASKEGRSHEYRMRPEVFRNRADCEIRHRLLTELSYERENPRGNLRQVTKMPAELTSFKEKKLSGSGAEVERILGVVRLDTNIAGGVLVTELMEPARSFESSSYPQYPATINGPLDNESIDKIQNVFVARLHSLKDADERAHIDTPRDGSVRGVLSGCWRLRETALGQLFEVNTNTSSCKYGVRVRRSYPEGRGVRDVAVVKADVESLDHDKEGLSFHFKLSPEFPFHELAINQLGLMLFGDAVLHDMLEVFMSGMWHGFLVSETVVGETIADELQWFDKNIHEMERQRLSRGLVARMCRKSFGRSCLLAMLCRLQDQKPDNVLIRENGTLACIDNERAFVVDSSGYWYSRSEVQSVLFCMDAMNDRIEDEIVRIITRWGENSGFELVGNWLRKLERLVSDLKRRSALASNLSSFVLAPAIVWKLIVGIAQLQRFAAVFSYRRMLEVLLPETSVTFSKVLGEFGSIQRRFSEASEYSGSALSSKLTTMEVMLKLLNEKVGDVKELEWSGGPFQPQTPTTLLNLTLHIKDRLMAATLDMIGLLNRAKAEMNERWWKRLTELMRSLHDMDLFDHVLDKTDFSRGMLSEELNQHRFIKLLEGLSHNYVVLAKAMFLSERDLSFLKNSPNLMSLSLKGCPKITFLPYSMSHVWQKLRSLHLEFMSLKDVLDFTNMTNLAKVEVIGVTGLRKLILSPSCVYLDLTSTWTIEMDIVDLGNTTDLKRENIIGMGHVDSASLEHVRNEVMKGNMEPLQHMPTTHEIEEVLEILDWSEIAERSDNGSVSPRQIFVEWISSHSFHRLFLRRALWITRSHLKKILRRSAFLKVLSLHGSNINKEVLMGALSSSSLPQLESLDLSDCHELDVSPKDINGVTRNLKCWNMSNTGIETFETEVSVAAIFGGPSKQLCLQALTQLNLSNCARLLILPSLQLPNLTNLDLSDCINTVINLNEFERKPFSVNFSNTLRYRELLGHISDVTCMVELRDGRLASGSLDSVVRIWDVGIGECATILRGHNRSVDCLVELRDGRLVSGSMDRTVKVWDVISGKCFMTLIGHTSWIVTVVELKNGRLASGSDDRAIRIWDGSKGECMLTLRGHSSSVNSVVELRDGRLASGSDKIVRIWGVNSGECVFLKGHANFVTCMVELRDFRLASGSSDNSVRIWNVTSGECVMILRGHNGSIITVLELQDHTLASGSDDTTARVWNLTNGECVATLIGHSRMLTSVVELEDGKLATGSIDCTVRIWDVSKATCSMILRGHNRSINSVVELRDGRLASGSDRTVRIWEIGDVECSLSLKGHTSWIVTVVELGDGKLISASRDSTLRVWNVNSGECLMILRGHTSPVISVVELRDGRLSSGSMDRTVKVWDLNSGECMKTLIGHSSWVTSVVELNHGRLASGADDRTVRVWDLTTGECTMILNGHTDSVRSIAELRSGRLVSGSRDYTVRVWDLITGECLITLEGHTGPLICIAELRDLRLSTGSRDSTVRVWDLQNGGNTMILRGHDDSVRSLVELRDGKLVSGSDDCTVRVWDMSNGICAMTLRGHCGPLISVVELSDGRLTTASRDSTVRVWDMKNGECTMILRGHNRSVNSVVELKDGRLASGSDDRTVKVWTCNIYS